MAIFRHLQSWRYALELASQPAQDRNNTYDQNNESSKSNFRFSRFSRQRISVEPAVIGVITY
jgi:hypothetical protein